MVKKRRKIYTNEFKVEAVKLLTEQGYSLAEAGKDLGVHPSLLGKWKNQLSGSGHPGPSSIGDSGGLKGGGYDGPGGHDGPGDYKRLHPALLTLAALLINVGLPLKPVVAGEANAEWVVRRND